MAPPATTAVEVQKEPTGQASEQPPEKGDEREDGEIGSESSESEECNSEADFDASDEEALPIAMAEKAAEGEPDEPGEPEAEAAKEGEAKSASETNEVGKAEEAQGGLEAGPEAQQQVDHAQSEGSQRRDFSRTIPVPRTLSGKVQGVCSPGVQIQIRMPPEQSRDPCLVSVSGTMEEVELAVSQIRSLHQQRGASDSVEFHIPRDATGQRLLQRLSKERLRRTANVTLKIDDDKQEEYYKAVLSGQPKDTDRAWLVALKATLGKADCS